MPNKKFSIISDIDINAFNSDVKNQITNKTAERFIIMPVLAGVKWSALDNVYFPGLAGVAIGLKNAGTNISLSPDLGYLVKVDGKPKLDVGLRVIVVLPQA